MRRFRLIRGLTQQVAADLVGDDYKYFQKIESGQWPNLTLVTVKKIANALKVKPWELLCDVTTGKDTVLTRKGVAQVPAKNR